MIPNRRFGIIRANKALLPIVAILLVVQLITGASARAATKTFTLTAEDKRVSIGLGLSYDAWTFSGSVPGPVLRVRQGDQVTIHLLDHTSMAHGIDTHAAQIAPDAFAATSGGKELTYSFRAEVPGVFAYHCSAIPMLVHIANGMYGMMIVDPRQGWPKAQEVMIVQGEFYGTPDKDGLVAGDSRKMMAEQAEFVVFNGAVNKYVDAPITIKVGRPVRIFFVNAGPNLSSTFHVIGVIFSTVYRGGNPADPLHDVVSFDVGPGQGAIFEFTVHQPGDYTFIDHSMAHVLRGAKGVFHAVP
ncbi:MAG: multicopper oxidase domain-containing protein [Candidatus Binataceae bacterium]